MPTLAAEASSLGHVSERSGFLDVVRVLAGVDIVAFHTGIGFGDGNALRIGFGITVFLLVSAVGVARHQRERKFLPFARERLSRYSAPFFFWCAVYAVVATIHSLRHGESPFAWWNSCMLWRGTEFHLWFMPVSLALALAMEAARSATAKRSAVLVVVTCVALSCIGILAGAAGWYLRDNDCWSPWRWAPPAAFLGLAMGRVLQAPPSSRRSLVLFGISLVVALWSLAVWRTHEGTFALRFATGSLLTTLGFVVPSVSGVWVRRFLALSIGIFLCHPLVLQLGFRFLDQLPLAVAILVVWLISAVIAFAMQQTPLARFAGERRVTHKPSVPNAA